MHRKNWIRMSVVVVFLAALAIVGIPAFVSHGGGKEPPPDGSRLTGPSLKGIVGMENNASDQSNPYIRFVGECNPGPGINNNMPVVVSHSGYYDLSISGLSFSDITAANLEGQTFPITQFINASSCNGLADHIYISGVNSFYKSGDNIFADVIVKFLEAKK